MEGEIADGGGDLTVVSILPVVVTVDLDVESVTIGSCAYAVEEMSHPATKTLKIFLNIYHAFCLVRS